MREGAFFEGAKVSDKKARIWACVFLAGITVGVYNRAWRYEFINYDDPDYVTENKCVQKGLTVENVVWAFRTGKASNWHPLTWLSLMLDYELYGLNAGGFHATNVLLHAANTVLLFLVLLRMSKVFWASAFVAALFGLHPLHVESVTWVAERKDVLSTMFWFLTMWAYVRYSERPSVSRYTGTIMLFALGLMAKPMLVTLPFVLLLLDYWPLNRLPAANPKSEARNPKQIQITEIQNTKQATSGRQQKAIGLLLEKVPFFILSAVSSVVTVAVQRGGGSVIATGALSLWERVCNAAVSYVIYIIKMFVPVRLSVFYPYMEGPGAIETIGAVVLLVCITVAVVVFSARGRKYLVTGWFWYVGTLVPVIGFVQVGAQAYADRYTYVPLVGLFIIAACGAPDLLRGWRYKRVVLAGSGVIVVGTLSILTWVQAGLWRDTITLFEHAVAVTKDNCVAHNVLANTYGRMGEVEKSIEHGKEAVRIFPRYDAAHYNLGMAYYSKGEKQKALEHWEETLRIKPEFKEANYNIGVALESMGKTSDAIRYFEKELINNPNHAGARARLEALRKLKVPKRN